MPDSTYDICIIGAGVVGAAIARELSRYEADIIILEKEDDVSCGASKANSGIVHGGYAAKHGTLRGELNVIGNRMYERLNRELNFGYRETGALVIGFDDADRNEIEILYANGIKNGVDGLEIIDRRQIIEMEPNINPEVRHALYCRHAGVTSPYEFTIALMENAISNGAVLRLNCGVEGIQIAKNGFNIQTDTVKISCRYIINAAGIFSDIISQMVGPDYFKIKPRKGQYVIFDRDTGSAVSNVIFQTPTKKGKGILVTSTFHGNLMIGPNAEDTTDRYDIETDEEALAYITETAKKSIPGIDLKKAIRSFSGIRAASDAGDFIIEHTEVPGLINVAGIDSPGLTSSPAIALRVVSILKEAGFPLKGKSSFDPYRMPIIHKKERLPSDEVERLIKIDPSPERIICRCEQVRESVITDALNRNIDIHSMDAVKRRTRAGMGRCQGKFCGPRVKEIIAREKNIPIDRVITPGRGSGILPGKKSKASQF